MSSSSNCYATLTDYNHAPKGTIGSSGIVTDHRNVPAFGYNVVPQWGSFGYQSLTHGGRNTNCGNYYTICSAYPNTFDKNCRNKSGACGQYVRRACAGVLPR